MGIRKHRGGWEIKVYDPAVKRLIYVGRSRTREEAERIFENAKRHFGARREPVDWEERFKALEHEIQASADDPDGALVYFIQGDAGGPVKIGISIDPPTRLAGLQLSSSERLVIRNVIPGGRDKERELHLRFKKFRLWGEWFAPCPELLELAKAEASHEQKLIALDLLQRQRDALIDRVHELEAALATVRAAANVFPPLQLPKAQPRAGEDDARTAAG